MPSEEEIVQHEELLKAHRLTLAQELRRAAMYGGETFARPEVTHGIDEARKSIKQIKGVLRLWGREVEDHPNDEPLPVPVLLPSSPRPKNTRRQILYIIAGIVLVASALGLRTLFLQYSPVPVDSQLTSVPYNSATISNTETSFPKVASTLETGATDTAQAPVNRHSYNILVDVRHGSSNIEKYMKLPDTFSFSLSGPSEFTEPLLKQYQLLIIDFVGYGNQYTDEECGYRFSGGISEFTPSEIKAIQNYVRDGGSVILVGVGWVWSYSNYVKTPDGKCIKEGGKDRTMDTYPLNKISQPAGIFFNNDYYPYFTSPISNSAELSGLTPTSTPELVTFNTVQWNSHPITYNVSKINVSSYLLFGGLELSNTQESAPISIATNQFVTNDNKRVSLVLIAATSFGKGRMICMQQGEFISKTHVDGDKDDKQIFFENMLSWLVKAQ